MQFFRLQIGCIAVLIYVAVVYLQGCSKYRVKITTSHFWIILLFGIFTVIVDGCLAWTVGVGSAISPVWTYVFHGLSFIGLDSTIFFLCIYLLDMMDRYPKKMPFCFISLFISISYLLS